MYDHELRNIIISLPMIHTLGLDATILFTVLQHFYRTDQEKEDNFFAATAEDLTIFTTLNKNRLHKAISLLQEKGLVEIENKGMPRRMHFRLPETDEAMDTIDNLVTQGEQEMEMMIEERMERILQYYR